VRRTRRHRAEPLPTRHTEGRDQADGDKLLARKTISSINP
jgi:hypothetical protein